MSELSTSSALHSRISELEAEVLKWRALAERDGLTGCLRREAFTQLIEQRKLFGFLAKSMTVAILDLDHFKQVNDTYGHLAGDKVLEHLGQLLTSLAPEGSLVCRMGGEEFAILLPGDSSENLPQLEKIRLAIARDGIRIDLKRELSVTASIGTANWNTDRPLVEALAKADEALYLAKSSGRNRVAA